MDVSILSTGGTARLLEADDVPVTEVSDYTGFPEIMDGRVKTLHPKIQGALLSRSGVDDEVVRQHDIQPIDLLVVNLYPFERIVVQTDCPLERAMENVDIGGPCLIRAAAKNHERVAVIVDPADYPIILRTLKENGGCLSTELRSRLARDAFARVASYDGAISNYLSSLGDKDKHHRFPLYFSSQFKKVRNLCYGENPHQEAALYGPTPKVPGTVGGAKIIQGEDISFNNLVDMDTALRCAQSFTMPSCVIVKHANPCGVAVDESALAAYAVAYASDPESAFGGVVAFNRCLDEETASVMTKGRFIEAIIAPSVSHQAAALLKGKPRIRVLAAGERDVVRGGEWDLDLKRVSGGLLLQDGDHGSPSPEGWKLAGCHDADEQMRNDLMFAWRVVRYVKSNAIVLAKDGRTLGVGPGQTSRVESVRLALAKAERIGLSVQGAVMASDAFFPFADGVEIAGQAGVSAVIQPGGSKQDKEVIAAADRLNMAMLLTGVRHFRH